MDPCTIHHHPRIAEGRFLAIGRTLNTVKQPNGHTSGFRKAYFFESSSMPFAKVSPGTPIWLAFCNVTMSER